MWTSGGVVGHRTGEINWLILDPIALLVAANIVWTGIRLLRETGYGLLDTALPVAEQQIIASTLLRYKEKASCFTANTGGWGAPLRVVASRAWGVECSARS